jgi:diacylglycerol kinase (ATP)
MQDQHASEVKPAGFNLMKRAKSFYFAGRGLYRMFTSQHNAWIHAVATMVVVSMGLAMNVARVDWCWLILCIFWVWTAETLNTAFECLADVASPEYHPLVRDAKDIAAGAVLISAIAAAIIGVIVFWPYWMA